MQDIDRATQKFQTFLEHCSVTIYDIYILAGDQVKERKIVVTWCFTPSQPVRLYQGEKERKTTTIK